MSPWPAWGVQGSDMFPHASVRGVHKFFPFYLDTIWAGGEREESPFRGLNFESTISPGTGHTPAY